MTRKGSLFNAQIISKFIFFVIAPQFGSLSHCSPNDLGMSLLFLACQIAVTNSVTNFD